MVETVDMFMFQQKNLAHKELTHCGLANAIRRQGTESTLAQVMSCCLTAPSHYLNQC